MFKKVCSLVMASVLTITGIQFVPQTAKEVKAATWNLVWSDEFDGNSLDTSTWSYETGGGGWGNNEVQYYTNRQDNVQVSDGTLKIIAKREHYDNREFTSGRLITLGKKAFLYGKMEARIRVEGGNQSGVWPAFWMMGNNMKDGIGWPMCGEIDIMEHANDANFVQGTLHWCTAGINGNWQQHGMYGSADANSNYYFSDNWNNGITGWHTYGLVWDANHMEWQVDGVTYYTQYLTDNNKYCFQKEQFFLLNLAIGGTSTGYTGYKTADANFQSATMYVDYVRVYQEGPDEPDTYVGTDTTTEKTLIRNDGWGYAFFNGNKGKYNGGTNLNDDFQLHVVSNNKQDWLIQAFTKNIDVTPGHTYNVSVNVNSDKATSSEVLMKDDVGQTNFEKKTLGVGDNVFSGTFTPTENNMQLMFNLSQVENNTTLTFKDLKITDVTPKPIVEGGELLDTNLAGSVWMRYSANNATFADEDGAVKIEVPAYNSGNNYDTQFRQDDFALTEGRWYTLSYTVSSTADKNIGVIVQHNGDKGGSWDAYAQKTVMVAAGTERNVELKFQAPETTSDTLVSVLMGYVDGVASDASTVKISNVSLKEYSSEPSLPEETIRRLEVPTQAPTTEAPTQAPTQAPTTEAPTQAPTQAPTTEAPTQAPITEAPTQAPITEAPTQAPVTEVPHNGKCDLIVTGIRTLEDYYVGDEAVFVATIKNIGDAATPAGKKHGLAIHVDEQSVSWCDNFNTSLAPGEEAELVMNWGPNNKNSWTVTAGEHTIWAMIDDDNGIEESNENNNAYETTMTFGTRQESVVTDAPQPTEGQKTELPAPAGLIQSTNESMPYYVAWQPVQGATAYNVYLNGTKVGETAGTAYNIPEQYFATEGNYNVSVAPVNANDEEGQVATVTITSQGQATQPTDVVTQPQTVAPTNPVVTQPTTNAQGETVTFIWPHVTETQAQPTSETEQATSWWNQPTQEQTTAWQQPHTTQQAAVETTNAGQQPTQNEPATQAQPTSDNIPVTTLAGGETTTAKGGDVIVEVPTTTKANIVKVGKTKVKKATKKKVAAKLKLTLKKIKGAKGYQVKIYKTKKLAKKNKKAIAKKVVKKAKVTLNKKKLKNKTKLYVRARAYVLVNGSKKYGKWSKVKRVKVK